MNSARHLLSVLIWFPALAGILGGRLAFVFVYNLDYYLAPQSPWTYLGHARFLRMAAEQVDEHPGLFQPRDR